MQNGVGVFLIKLKTTLKNTYLAGIQLVDYGRIYGILNGSLFSEVRTLV